MRVLAIGDSVIDCYMHTGYIYPGGNSANFCVYSAMCGAQSSYLGVFGNDEAAAFLKNALEIMNVDCQRSRNAPFPTNRCGVYLKDGDREISDDPAYDLFAVFPIVLSEDEIQETSGFDAIHTSFYAHIDEQLPAIKKASDALLIYDFSHHWTSEMLDAVCPNIDIGFFSLGHMPEDEATAFLKETQKKGNNLVIGTMGASGVLACSGRRFYKKSPYGVDKKVRDTMGAGDAFITGFTLNYANMLKAKRLITQKGVKIDMNAQDLADFEDVSIESSMACGNLLASKICQMDASFGLGIPMSELGSYNVRV